MCGIAGKFGHTGSSFAGAAVEALRHRGPDGHGVWESGNVCLVHTRLAVIDLSDAGRQPMVFEEKLKGEIGKLKQEVNGRPCAASLDPFQLSTFNSQLSTSVLIFNGEIYNHAELRTALEAQGETFVGHSDTEVLLRLLVREGEACLPKLAGMFAFALWNEVTGEALLARDPYGIKPLYYRTEAGGGLAFASESHVLRRVGDEVDASALRDFFLWGSVPEPQTLFSKIRQVPAGCLLRWKNGQVSVEEWHGLGARRSEYGLERDAPATFPSSHSHELAAIHNSENPSSHLRPLTSICGSIPSSRSEVIAATRAALEESMRRHLVSDVPVGIFLSGGIDSTVVLALTRQALGPGADIRTFSIGFDDPAFDESSLARRTAEHFGARHTEWKMTPEEGAAEIPAFLAAADQPSIDGFNTWCVSKLARREGMKVVMSGLGGDEFFAGYGSFERVPKFHRLYRQLGPLRGIMATLLSMRPAGSPWRRLAASLKGGGTWLEAFHAQRGIFTAAEAEQLAKSLTGKLPSASAFSDSLSSISEPRSPTSDSRPLTSDPCPQFPDSRAKDPREIVSELETSRYMRNQLLRDSDVFSMAHGLELRVPLVDVRLAETLLSLPPAERLRQGKQLLLDAVPEVPEWIRNQPKRGFRFPFQQWMEGQFGELLSEAKHKSPVALNAWYRTWAVAVVLRAIMERRNVSAVRMENQ